MLFRPRQKDFPDRLKQYSFVFWQTLIFNYIDFALSHILEIKPSIAMNFHKLSKNTDARMKAKLANSIQACVLNR